MASFTLYDAVAPQARRALDTLSLILKKAEAATSSVNLAESRLHPDMLPLRFQVYQVTNVVHQIVERGNGAEVTKPAYDLQTFSDFLDRIEQSKAVLAKLDKNTLNSRADMIVPMILAPGKAFDVPVAVYLNSYALPNLFFHLITAYNILRKEGVELGKLDYLAAFFKGHLEL